MQIPVLNAYRDTNVNNTQETAITQAVKKSNEEDNNVDSYNLNNKKQNNLLTPKEREFFIGMFPDSSDQLEKHVLFNRSGRIQTLSLGKGAIVDGRV